MKCATTAKGALECARAALARLDEEVVHGRETVARMELAIRAEEDVQKLARQKLLHTACVDGLRVAEKMQGYCRLLVSHLIALPPESRVELEEKEIQVMADPRGWESKQ